VLFRAFAAGSLEVIFEIDPAGRGESPTLIVPHHPGKWGETRALTGTRSLLQDAEPDFPTPLLVGELPPSPFA
jgi:hypothetical protein